MPKALLPPTRRVWSTLRADTMEQPVKHLKVPIAADARRLERALLAVPYHRALIGAPDTLAREIEAAANAVPINECFLLIPQGLHTRDQIMRSLELFGTKVLPKFSA